MDTEETKLFTDYDSSKERNSSKVNILCLNLSNKSKLIQFLVASGTVFVIYTANGYFVELIFSTPELKSSSLYITFVECTLITAFSYVEYLINAKEERIGQLKIYAVLAFFTLGTFTFSSLALSYINFPTQIIFKSCKVIPVMIGSIVILKKRYSILEYVAAVVMCIGLISFTLADSKLSPNFDITGVFVISLALVCDAIIGNMQEMLMTQNVSNNEVVLYSFSIASVYLLVYIAAAGVLQTGIEYCNRNPVKTYGNILMLSLTCYLGMQAVLTLMRVTGATITVTVTTMRKIFSISLSFFLYNKPFVVQYLWSGMLIVLAIYLTVYKRTSKTW